MDSGWLDGLEIDVDFGSWERCLAAGEDGMSGQWDRAMDIEMMS